VKTDPALWAELSGCQMGTAFTTEDINNITTPSDDPDGDTLSESLDDNLSIPLTMHQQHILTRDSRCGHIENKDGNLVPTSMTKTLDDEAADTDHEFMEDGRGNGISGAEDLLYTCIMESLMAGPLPSRELG
jgi:hypothetical protein